MKIKYRMRENFSKVKKLSVIVVVLNRGRLSQKIIQLKWIFVCFSPSSIPLQTFQILLNVNIDFLSMCADGFFFQRKNPKLFASASAKWLLTVEEKQNKRKKIDKKNWRRECFMVGNFIRTEQRQYSKWVANDQFFFLSKIRTFD